MSRVVFAAVIALGAATIAVTGQQAPTLQITSPGQDTLVSGPTRLEASIEPASAVASVKR